MDLLSELDAYERLFKNEKETVDFLKDFINYNNQNIYNRKNMNGHITASGLVIDNGKVLLIEHPYIKTNLLPGGHVEKGETTVDAAIREIYEETGYSVKLSDKLPCPLNIDIHTIAENPKKNEKEHIHMDFCYLMKLDNHSNENNELNYLWQPIESNENSILSTLINELNEIGC